MRRRDALASLVLTGVVAATSCTGAAMNPHPRRRIERLGLQLFTVRDALAKDVAGTLAAVAEAGYAEVETAGTADLSPMAFAQALKNAGLRAPSAHVPIELMATQPEELLSTAQAMGHQYLVVPWLPPEMRNAKGYGEVVDTLNQFGEYSAAAGVQTCYHNHDFEFTQLDGQVVYDSLLQRCDPQRVRFELDLYWAAHAGADAAAYLRADPDRFPLCHVKDRTASGEMSAVGAGELDFPELFAAGSGLKHYFVEHDNPTDSLASIRASIKAVRGMTF